MPPTIRTLPIFLMLFLILTGVGLASEASTGETFLPAPSARLGESLAIFERSEENSLVRFGEGWEVVPDLQNPSGAKTVLAYFEHPLAVRSEHIDSDGALDLVVAYQLEVGGAVVVYRGNPDFMMSPRVKDELLRETGLEISAFLDPATVVELSIKPDFLEIGDFDADGFLDVVAGERGGAELLFFRVAGEGPFGDVHRVALGGPLTALTAGEVNRWDDLQDLVAAVVGPSGPQILVFESPDGALVGPPEVFDTETAMTHLAIGQLDGDGARDIAAAGSDQMLIITGRDRKLPLSKSVQAEVAAAAITRLELRAEVESLAIGNLNGDARDELAVLGADGVLEVVDLWKAGTSVPSVSIGLPGEDAVLQTARVSGLRYDDVLVLDSAGKAIEILSHNVLPGAKVGGSDWHHMGKVTAGAPMGALIAGRFDFDALDDLVVLADGADGPAVMVREPLTTYTVNSTDNVNDGVCDAAHCSFREAQLAAEASPGVDTIRFEVGFDPIQLTSNGLSYFSESVVIDGTEGQPPFTHFTEIDGSGLNVGSGPILSIGGPSTTLTLLIVGGHPGDDCVRFDGADNSLMTLSRIGVGLNGLTDIGCSKRGVHLSASGVTIGGTGFSSKNVIGGNGQSGIEIYGTVGDPWAASENWIIGNYIGTDSSGAWALGNDYNGVAVSYGASNHIGGYIRGNVIAGNLWIGVYDAMSEGTTVGANLIGVDAAGSSAIPNDRGVWIYGSTNTSVGGTATTVRNIISGNIKDGIRVSESASAATEIFGNFIGTDVTGASAIPNGEEGVVMVSSLVSSPDGVSVGGASSGSGNLISGNVSAGIQVNSGQNITIQGNLIGSDATGAYAVPNGGGITIVADGVLVGGTDPLEGNLISGNTGRGIRLFGAGSLTIQGNRIGTDAAGTGALGNGDTGIEINVTSDPFSVIGGTGEAANTVAFNGGAGLALVSSSFVNILPNSLHSNTGLGIDLGADGVTTNDPGDADGGPNNTQNFPVISGVTPGAADVTIDGTLNSSSNGSFTLYFFRSSSCDPSGYGEGEIYLGYAPVSTNASGNASFSATFPVTVSAGAFITATATRIDGPWGYTSEFSACFEVGGDDSLIFADGFESGNLTAWSSTVGN